MGKNFRTFLLGGVSAIALLSGGKVDAAPVNYAFTGAIETGTIAQSGTYRITLGGATGGSYVDGGVAVGAGGIGAYVSGYAYLAAGTPFSVLVGGAGEQRVFERGGGGGGLSYFNIGADQIIEAIAGGGGGGYYGAGGAGRAGTSGGEAEDAQFQYRAGYTDDNGQYVPPVSSFFGYGGYNGVGGLGGEGDGGSGGAGVVSNGGANGAEAYGNARVVTGGQNASGGWAGGGPVEGAARNRGGFGGGGGGGVYGGGGGGGFSGGGGSYYYGGGGGGSYLSGLFSNTRFLTGGATSGSFVSYELVSSATVPVPASFGFLAGVSGLALVAAARRRRRRKAD